MNAIQRRILNCYEILEKYHLGDALGAFQDDILKYGYWLAAADDSLDRAEQETLNSLFNTAFSKDTLRNRYYQAIDSPDSFAYHVPEIIRIIAEEEKKANYGIQAMLYDTREVYQTFKMWGMIIISCNGRRMKIQVNALDRSIRLIVRYIIDIENRLDVGKEHMHGTVAENGIEDLGGMAYQNAGDVSALKDEETVKLLAELDGMIGLDAVKKEVHNLVNLIKLGTIRKAHGLEVPFVSMHLVFTGNPGTGKTIMARKIAQIYRSLGILKTGNFVETDRAGMVAGYMGQTAELVRKRVEEARGGVLFIDEAYTLSNSGNEGDYGQEAIDALLKYMEDYRDEFSVIVAGYPKEMEHFLNSNPGLKSRFNKYIYFDDYSAEELFRIFMELCGKNDYKLSPAAEDQLLYVIVEMMAKKGNAFANARDIRNLFEKVITTQANRIINEGISDVSEIMTIKGCDLL